MSLSVTVHLADIIAHCGQIDMNKVNSSAVGYLSERKGPGLSQDMIVRTAEDIRAKVVMLLDI